MPQTVSSQPPAIPAPPAPNPGEVAAAQAAAARGAAEAAQAAAQAPAAPGRATAPGPAEVLRGFRAQREALGKQLETLGEQREEITRQILQARERGLDISGLQQRLNDVDKRISVVDGQIALADAEVARSSAVPGAVQPEAEPRVIYRDSDEGPAIVFTVFTVFVLFPLAIAWARRLWKRPVAVSPVALTGVNDRLQAIEQSIEAVAMEVERIGEGQRFMSRLFTERGVQPALGEGAAQPVPVPRREASPALRQE